MADKPTPEHQEIDYVARKDALVLAIKGRDTRTANTVVQRAEVFRDWLRDGTVPEAKFGEA